MSDLSWNIEYGHAIISIRCDIDLRRESVDALVESYSKILAHINRDPFFASSYEPINTPLDSDPLILKMVKASTLCGVGPMAAVAGTIAEYVGKKITSLGAGHVIVENGGDIYLDVSHDVAVGVHAGDIQLSDEIILEITPSMCPLGICTSSAYVGHSVSLGKTDAVTCFSKDTSLSDAAATSIANQVNDRGDLEKALGYARNIKGLDGLLILADECFSAWGDIPEFHLKTKL